MKLNLMLLVCFMCFFSCSNDDDNTNVSPANQFTDSRDGQVYDIVTIGNQTWFAENLKYDIGDDTSVCYDDETDNCFIYGRLYTGEAAQTACPEGWHLPSQEEWDTLIDYLGGISAAHVFFKPFAMQQGEPVGFNLLAGGWHFAGYQDIGVKGYYYTSTDGGLPNSYKQVRIEPNVLVTTSGIVSFNVKQSCRCIKD
ncbi:FISUMP domain-containing protein [Tamlana sp. 2201CG12-4]|uniref:FISUMP domain-containing protein n=1 Tax=Tamlana sp. 2201CG12-4 TaxID=3112582 RepID=UPI002DBD6ABE|nr:FISUMP domain-containing protein [Tamlana sp. 2201CG12-4]MEC3905908.1 FISUMP domain-containing protein [Tamlana sp. 2201CG12-4]